MLNIVVLAILLAPLAHAASEDPIAAAHQDESAKAQQTFTAALTKADERAIKSLATAATAAQRGGDLATSAAAWKEVLRFDRDHADARAFFTAAGTLDAALAEVVERRPVPQPGALPTRMPAQARPLTIAATIDGEADLGSLPAGTTIVLAYASGTWAVNYGNGAGVQTSPDEVASNPAQRVVILDLASQPAQVLAMVPTGTKERVFAYQLIADCRKVALAIAPAPPKKMVRNTGSVVYQVAVLPPAP